MKESIYSNEHNRCIFRFTGNSEFDCRRNGGQVTDVTFDNGVATFDGATSFIDYSNSKSITNGLTVCTWRIKFNLLALAINNTLLAKWDYQTQGQWSFQTDTTASAELKLYIATSLTDNGTLANLATSDANMVAGNDYELVLVFDGSLAAASRFKAYLNGILLNGSIQGTFPTSLQKASSTIKSGKFGGSLDRFLDGDEDLLEIYNYALTAEEVSNLYEGKRFRALVSPDMILDISSSQGSIVDSYGNSLTNTAVTVVKSASTKVMKFDGSSSFIGTEMAGVSDWFLPSKDELDAMRTNLHDYGVGGFSAGASDYYWCSTERAAFPTQSSFMRFLESPFWGTATKNQAAFIRSCRSFTAAAGAYSLRSIGPAGGLIFYIDGGTTYYELALSDQSASQIWSNIDTGIGATAQGEAIGTGQGNTTAIIGQAGHVSSGAKLADDLEVLNLNYIIGVLSPTTAGSMAAWIRTDDNSVTQEVVSYGDLDQDTRLQWDVTGAGLIRGLAGIGGVTKWSVETNNTVIVNGVWTHVALVQDGTEPVLYVNGIAVAQTFSTSTDKTFWFSQMSGLDNGRIGCGNWNGGGNATFFSGMLNEIRVFTSALTAQKLSQIFSESRKRYLI